VGFVDFDLLDGRSFLLLQRLTGFMDFFRHGRLSEGFLG
jgi:hypothetical protein